MIDLTSNKDKASFWKKTANKLKRTGADKETLDLINRYVSICEREVN